MSQESRRPARSLRESGESKYYRDWSAEENRQHASSEAGMHELDQIVSSQAPEDMQMVDVLADEEALTPASPLPAASSTPVGQEMAPLNVIVPEAASAPKTAEKPKVTRMDRTKLQRARRYSELKAEEEQKRKEAEAAAAAEAAARKEANKTAPPEQSAKTRSLPQNHTTQLQNNLQNVNEKLDQTRENVKTTADALSQNIRELSDKITVKVVSGVQNMSKTLNRWINRLGKNTEPIARETDFEDAPIESATSASHATSLPADRSVDTSSPPVAKHPLAHISRVPVVQYADLLKENVFFQDYNKAPLVDHPEALNSYTPDDLQTAFIDAALQDIRRCVKLVRDLPDPKEGPYTGLPVAYIFKHVTENDLFFFMHYVLSKPGPFAKKTFKISEAFGTWILKRSAITIVAEPFPEVPALEYYPLYKRNIRFVTRDRKALVLAGNKTPESFEAEFLERSIDDIRHCVPLVENFPPTEQGPYKQRPLRQIFRYVQERDIHFFLHYVKDNPDVFQGQNFKFAEAFASWILKRSHETQLNQ
jgi:hypothetical protein